MMPQMSHEVAFIQDVDLATIGARLKKWNAEIDPSRLKLISIQSVTWNNGSLGCAIPGHFYTQALVPGYILWIEHGSCLIELHSDQHFRALALPGIGGI